MRYLSFLTCLLWCAVSLPAQNSFPINLTNLQGALLSKAAPDECWAGLSQNKRGSFPPCPQGASLKVNQGYVWSLAQTDDLIWFGTTAVFLCGAEGEDSVTLLAPNPYENSSWACEYGKSPYSPNPYTPNLGDLRPPRLYVYRISTGQLTDITPAAPVTYNDPWGLDSMVIDTVGFRAATVVGGDVVFAGLSIHGGINMFAFRVSDFTWVAGENVSQYQDIRRFVWADGVLYTGVRTNTGGAVLRYTGQLPAMQAAALRGDKPPNCPSCFTFTDVQDFDSDIAEVALDNNRLYVGTWPGKSDASIYMSPDIPAGGLMPNGPAWTGVFNIDQYEPDAVQATAYGIGAMASFGGYLYFGTQNPPHAGVLAYTNAYGKPKSQDELTNVEKYSFRSTVFFRMSGQENGTPHVDLLYGDPQLYVYTAPRLQPHGGTWSLAPNKLTNGAPALYGSSGFNNPYNAYTWSMAVWNSKLYVGTFDWTYIAPLLPLGNQGVPPIFVQPTDPAGADLFSFADTNSPAVIESNTGVGNPLNYGIRNILPGSNQLFLGMANPMTLATTPGMPNGGWELIELVSK
jgi:hypothetical protein